MSRDVSGGTADGTNRLRLRHQCDIKCYKGVSSPRPMAGTPSGSDVGTLIISSVPSSASVFIDNKEVGVTPFQNEEVTAGEYEIRVKAEGYRDWVKRVEKSCRCRGGISRENSCDFGFIT